MLLVPEANFTLLIQDSRRCRYTLEVTDGNCTALFKMHFKDSNREAVVAARGERKHEKGRWKYQSEASFVDAKDEAWQGMPLKGFQNAKARAGTSLCCNATVLDIQLSCLVSESALECIHLDRIWIVL